MAYATESLGLSQRKACQLTGISPSTYTDRSGVMMMSCDARCVNWRERGIALAVPGCTSC